jgi:membrane protein
MTRLLPLLKETAACWSAHNAQKMGAALAYYTALSLAPLVIMIVGIGGMLASKDEVRKEVVAQVSSLVGDAGKDTIDSILSNPANHKAGKWATIIGFIVLLVGASGVFGELQDSLNTIWQVPVKKRRWHLLIKKRLLSIGMVFALGFLVLVSLLLSAAIAAVRAYLKGRAPDLDAVWELGNTGVSLVLMTLLFAAVFRFLPDTRIAWRDVWLGAALTAALFILGKFLLGLYLAHSAFASAYGAAGSLLIVLVWVFYSAQIFFFGAEFTYTFACRRGSRCHEARPEVQAAS